MKSGAVGFLTKPFEDQDLPDTIREGLNRDRTMREASTGSPRRAMRSIAHQT
jgi:FixJ family two-component response regulator